jgi:hypothetical protein
VKLVQNILCELNFTVYTQNGEQQLAVEHAV